MEDLSGIPVELVSAGWNHSVVLTKRGHIYTCGHNENGQLGLNDAVHRTRFTHVSEVGNKNVHSIKAGGNHTWLVLDETQPVLADWAPPAEGLGKQKSEEEKSVVSDKMGDLGSFLGKAPVSKWIIQCVYTDTQLSHRFIRFSLLDRTSE